jgi:CMP-N-acetylneuraminic acid synthetase
MLLSWRRNLSVVAFIFARGGSKGLVGKNIRDFLGKPLIAWAIECALNVDCIDRVIVSTDCKKIAKVAREYGAEVPFLRPAHLASDYSPEWLSWQHALQYLQEHEQTLPEIMVSIPATAPLRQPIDVINCINKYKKGAADIVIGVSESQHNPSFNMVYKGRDDRVELILPLENSVSRRQDAGVTYEITTVAYVMNPNFVLDNRSIFSGHVKAVVIPRERAIDIDTLLDFKIAEFLARQNNG